MSEPLAQRICASIRDVPDFPKPGIMFKDITPVLGNSALLHEITQHFAHRFRDDSIDVVAGIESRGFILGGALAVALGVGFVPIRKPGKLPHARLRVEYELEYGVDALEAHIDAVAPRSRVLIVDDVLATGGTAGAAIQLMRNLGADVTAAAFLIELEFLAGRSRLQDLPVTSIVGFA